MLDWLFGKNPARKRDNLLEAFERAMVSGKLDAAEAALREGVDAFPGEPIFVVNLAKLVWGRSKDEARALLARARSAPGAPFELWRASAELAIDTGDANALTLARETLTHVNGDDELRRIVFTPLARRLYWSKPRTAETTEDPDQLALHAKVAGLRQLGFMGLLRDHDSLWDALPPPEKRPEVESAFVTLDEAQKAFRKKLPPRVEIAGKVRRLGDGDPFTHGSFEVFDLERGLRFVPFHALRSVRFERVRLMAKVDLVRRDGREESFWMPLFYRWTELDPQVLQGNMTRWIGIYGDTRVPIGLRDFLELGDDGREKALVSPVHVLPHEWRFLERDAELGV